METLKTLFVALLTIIGLGVIYSFTGFLGLGLTVAGSIIMIISGIKKSRN